MSQKYNISSIVYNKLNDIENKDEEDKQVETNSNEEETKLKTLSDSNKESSSSSTLKNKDLNDVINDLKDIENSYLTKDYIDAPENLELETIEVPYKTEEDLLNVAKSSLENKYNTNKNTTESSFEKKINDLIKKQEEYETTANKQKDSISESYDAAINETENQALKRGLARSSIVIEQLSKLNSEKASELVNVMNSLQQNLNNNMADISNLESEKEAALNNLDIEYAIELENKLNDVKADYEKSVKEAIEFNNNIKKLQAEYKLELDKQKLDKQESITKLENQYNVDYISTKIKEAQYDYLKEYFDSLDKDYAISLFLTNKELVNILGDNYSKMYKYLTNK